MLFIRQSLISSVGATAKNVSRPFCWHSVYTGNHIKNKNWLKCFVVEKISGNLLSGEILQWWNKVECKHREKWWSDLNITVNEDLPTVPCHNTMFATVRARFGLVNYSLTLTQMCFRCSIKGWRMVCQRTRQCAKVTTFWRDLYKTLIKVMDMAIP